MASRDNSADTGSVKSQTECIIKKKVTKKEVEKWEVALLNFNIEPCSKPSELFEKIEERRKTRHENALRKLAHDLHNVNLKTEKNILLSSLEVKSHMKHSSDQLEEILQSIDIPEVVSYDNSVFLQFQSQANNLKLQQQKMINELHQDLNKFEDERAVENEKIYHVACEEIRKIAYFLPYEVQTFIENETLKVNQLSLNNRRCYDDLKLTLTLITARTFKEFTEKMFCCKDNWLQDKTREEVKGLGKKKPGLSVRDAYYRFELRGRALSIRKTPDNLYSICKYEVWIENVLEVVNCIERNAKSIIDVYKKILKATYNMLDADLDEIKKEIQLIHLIDIEERAIRPLIIEADVDDFSERQDLEVSWQEILFEVKPQLEEMMDFLYSVIDIWQKHSERICEAKKLILLALEKEEEDDKAEMEDLEVQLNIALDNLRQEFEKHKLEKAYDAAIDLLNTIKAKHESDYLRKISTVEDFYKMTKLEKDVLDVELNDFLNHSQPYDNKILYLHEDPNQNSSDTNLTFKLINICGQVVKNMGFWKGGVWRALRTLAKSPNTIIQPNTEEWVEKKVENLAEVMSTQVELIDKRFGRVRVEYYEKRLAEIESHESLFHKHTEDIKRIYDKIKADLKNLTENQTKILAQAEKTFDSIAANAQLENRPEVIQCSQIMLEQRKLDLVESVKSFYEAFRAEAEAKIHETKFSNLNLMKSIKLFHEGGNYSAEEGKMYANKLEAVDKHINEYKNVIKESLKEENEMTKKASAIFTPTLSLLSFTILALLYEETLFPKQAREKFCDFIVKTKDLVKVFLSDFESLKKFVNCFVRRVRNKEKPLDDADFWLPPLQILYKNFSNFFYPLEYPQAISNENEGEREEDEESHVNPGNLISKSTVKAPVFKTQTRRTLEPELHLNFKDYKRELFHSETPPENDGTFMAAVSNAIWDEMSAQQALASKFYTKIGKRKILRDDLMPLSYDEFASGVLSKLQLCNYECERFWLRAILDFLWTLGRMKRATNYFLERKMEEYRDLTYGSLNAHEHDFTNCLQCLKNDTKKTFRDLEDKLLPLHGNPRNENILNNLEEEVVSRTAVLGIQWDSAVELFQDQLKCFHYNHITKRSEIDKIKIQFNKIKDKLFTEELGNTLAELLLSYANKGGYYVNRTAEERKGQKQEASLTCDRMLSDCQLNLASDDEKVDIDVYFKQLKEVIEMELSNLPGKAPAAFQDDQKPAWWQMEFNLLLPPIDFEDSAFKIVHPLDQYLRKLRTFAQSKANVHEEILFKWLGAWKFNVNKIKKLYTVRYTEKPELPQSSQNAKRG